MTHAQKYIVSDYIQEHYFPTLKTAENYIRKQVEKYDCYKCKLIIKNQEA